MKVLLAASFVLLLLGSCSTAKQLLAAAGVQQTVYRQKTDLLLTELHYPITTNNNLDSLLRKRILNKYQQFRSKLNENSIQYLNQGAIFTYRMTFDALRSPDLRIISFVLYETWEVQRDDTSTNIMPQTPEGNKDSTGISFGQALNSSTKTEVVMYSLKFDSVVDFFDVIEEPLLAFQGLAKSCLRQLNEYIGPGNFYSQGIQPDRQHLSMLSFGKSGILVSFPPGQVLSADQGVVNILVPWSEAIPNEPWQYGIIRSFRPLSYRKKEAKAAANTVVASP